MEPSSRLSPEVYNLLTLLYYPIGPDCLLELVGRSASVATNPCKPVVLVLSSLGQPGSCHDKIRLLANPRPIRNVPLNTQQSKLVPFRGGKEHSFRLLPSKRRRFEVGQEDYPFVKQLLRL